MQISSAKEKYISSQIKYWQQQKEKLSTKEIDKIQLPFITISREYGCFAYKIGEKIAELLNNEKDYNPVWTAYDKQLLENIMNDLGLSSSLTETLTGKARKQLTNLIQTSFSKFPPQVAVFRKLAETVTLLAANGNAIIIGRAGNAISRNFESGFHVRIIGKIDWKIENIRSKTDLSKKDAKKLIETRTDQRDNFIKEFVKFDVKEPTNYHLVINHSRYTVDEVAQLIIHGLKTKGMI